MIVGLPGVGIGAIFYLLCVVLMPFAMLYRVARGEPLAPGHPRLLVKQMLISFGLVSMLVLTGLLLTVIVGFLGVGHPVGASEGSQALGVGRIGLVIVLATLAIVLGTTKALSILTRPDPEARRLEQRTPAISLRDPAPSQE
jgi:hypothetical protein